MERQQQPEFKEIPQEKLEELYNPYEVKAKVDASEEQDPKEWCELCQSLPCCPEHCCDWDTCECGDCDECQPKAKKLEQIANKERPANAYKKTFNVSKWKHEYEPCDEPEFIIKSSGEEKIEKNKIKRKIVLSQKEQEQLDASEAEKTYLESVPNELIQMPDELQIRNFEVDFTAEQEIRYASGVRGIKALRMQRDLINDGQEEEEVPAVHDQGNKFAEVEKDEPNQEETPNQEKEQEESKETALEEKETVIEEKAEEESKEPVEESKEPVEESKEPVEETLVQEKVDEEFKQPVVERKPSLKVKKQWTSKKTVEVTEETVAADEEVAQQDVEQE